MTIRFMSLAVPSARSVTLRSVLALFDATGDEAALVQNLGRLMVARAVAQSRRGML